MKYRVFLLALFCLVVQLAGCSGESVDSPKPDNWKIPVIENLKAEDVEQIKYDRRTITDTYDIGACIAGMQSLRLTGKPEEILPDYTRAFEFILKNGSKVTISFSMNIVSYGEGYYHYSEIDNPVVGGSVKLTSQGKTFKPYEWWVSSQSYDGLCADGFWFGKGALDFRGQLQSDLDKLEAIPYSDDFVFDCVWAYDPDKNVIRQFSIFDENLNQISHNESSVDIPDEKGIYYMAVNVGWRAYGRSEGYQYIFKIERD